MASNETTIPLEGHTMFTKISEKLDSTKQFVGRHKVAFTAVTTAAVTTVAVSGLQKGALKEAYDFIDEYGLTEKFVNSVHAHQIEAIS